MVETMSTAGAAFKLPLPTRGGPGEGSNRVVRRAALAVIASVPLASSARAHVLDEYLQSTLVAIEPEGVRLFINLTPGAEIADQVLPLIDTDRDNEISPGEIAAYSEKLKQDLVVRLDGHDAALALDKSNILDAAELQTGHGIIQLEFSATTGPIAAGTHKLSFENQHLPATSA